MNQRILRPDEGRRDLNDHSDQMISASEINRSAPTHMTGEDARQHAVRWAWGLFERKPRWSLSWRGRLLALLLITGFDGAAFFSIHPFLAVTNRIDADVLVVEGWVHEYAISSVNYQELAGRIALWIHETPSLAYL